MKKNLLFVTMCLACVFVSCDNEKEDEKVVAKEKQIAAVDYNDELSKSAKYLYDEEGRIAHMELSEGFYPEGVVNYGESPIRKQNTIDINYDLKDGKINISGTCDIKDYPNQGDLTGTFTYTLLLSDNKIKSIQMSDQVMNVRDEQFIQSCYTMEYDSDNCLKSITKTRGENNESKTYECELEWKEGNLVACNQLTPAKGLPIVPNTYKYGEKTGCLPTFNVFTLLLGDLFGSFGNYGYLGNTPRNILEGYSYKSNNEYKIAYSYTEDYISGCTVDWYRYDENGDVKANENTYNMKITWE